jgi:N-acetylmuramoyl-L-alanine amidase
LETSRSAVIRKIFLIPPKLTGNYRLVVDLEATSGGGRSPIAAGTLPPILQASPPAPKLAPVSLPVALPLTPSLPQTPHSAEQNNPHKERHAGKPIVVIDPGHGGVDPGATSLSGAYEKNIVLALAHDLKEALEHDGKVTVVLTRDRDIFIPLRERVAIARSANADLFLSLHADIVTDPDIHGLSVYTLSQHASDAETQALADKENKADIVAGIDLSNESPEVTNILIDLVQRESMNLSAGFAHRLISEVAKDTHQLLQNTHRFAGFAVLKAPDIPSVLVESGYLSNDRDEQMLRRPEYRAKLAAALARAIESFLVRPTNMRRS